MSQNLYANLDGKIALVTGAGLGIGAALSRALGRLGVTVICASRTQDDIDEVAEQIADDGGKALAVPTDVTRPDQIESLANAINDNFGKLDLAFLNAGGKLQQDSILDSDIDEWRAAIELNLYSVFYGIRAVAPLMKKAGGGRIVLTGSAMAHYPAENYSSYCVAKAGARMLVNTAALELITDNIALNEFIPGPTRTLQAMKGVSEDNVSSPFNNPAEWVKEPEDVVDMLLTIAAYPGMGPTGQKFSLARR